MTGLELATRATADGAVLEVTGDLDHDTAAAFRASLTEVALGPGQTLTLDLAGLEFCDSSGITALITARNHSRSQGAETVLARIPAETARVLHFVGLDQILRIETAGTGEVEPSA